MDDSLILSELRGLRGEITALRGDMTAGHQAIYDRMGAGFEAARQTAAAHELLDTTRFAMMDKRFSPIESAMRYGKWMATTGGGVLVIAVVNFLLGWFKSPPAHP